MRETPRGDAAQLLHQRVEQRVRGEVPELDSALALLRFYERAIEATTDGIIICGVAPEYKILYTNPAFERITGYSASEALGRNCRFLQGNDRDQSGLQNIRLALAEKCETRAVLRNYRKDGTLFWNELHLSPIVDLAGNIEHFVGTIVDITLRKQMEEQLVHQATHDVLTDLPNRALLLDRIQQAIINAERTRKLVAVLFLDLDRFKLINDSLSHDAGDRILHAVAKRLLSGMRETDTVARIGGDEFVIVLPMVEHEDNVILSAQKILNVIAEPFRENNHEINITTSIGISFYPTDERDAVSLLRSADMAMYQAKESGRNNFQFYKTEMNKRLVQRLAIEHGLCGALERKEFHLVYQPIFELATGKIIGAEALLRWSHPRLGNIPPLDFIPIAEEIGLINAIGEWVLQTACQQNRLLQDKNHSTLTIAINLSGRQLNQPDIVEIITKALKKSGIDPKYLELELKENILIKHPERNLHILNRLKDLGVQLVIDDFGTGYSSLSYLKFFPIDKVKIDQSFIAEITNNPDNAVVIKAIIAMAKSLNINVIAEGVETEQQLEYLRQHGCHEAQGYYFSRPIEAEAFMLLLDKL